ncbi:MAG: choice-of-anchor B family protein [Planctomycetes bacterium]|nr:choice-of-anchor B family protein [Planctomycetota bacterium]
MKHPFQSSAFAATALLLSAATLFAHDGDPKLRDKQPMYAGPGWRNSALAGGGGSPMLMAPPSDFARSGVTLLSWLSLPDLGVPAGGNGNSCFGYTSPSGREYALMGTSVGTSIVEVSQPGNPVIVATILGPQSLWRDVRTYSHYAYAISEGGSGIQVIDLANVDNGVATLVNTINDDATPATHTIAINTQSGYLYRSGGGSSGLRIYNLNSNPAAPARVGTWSARYVHEASIFTMQVGATQKEIAFCCGGQNGGTVNTGIYVVDVTNKANPVQLQYVAYANSGYCHQCWPSPDMTKLYMDDELDDENLGITSVMRVFDISTTGSNVSLSFAGTYTNGNTAIDHNLYTKNDRILAASYRAGLRVYSTSGAGTPNVPVEIGYFDTYPGDDQTYFNGLWNVYPYFPSGTVIGSDIERGLFVWWVGTPPLTIDIPGGAPSVLPPGGLVLQAHIGESSPGTLVPGSVTLHYGSGASFQSVAMQANASGNYAAALPAGACGSNLIWYVSAQSTNGILWTAPEGASGDANLSVYGSTLASVASNDFETTTGWQGAVAGDTATSGQWVNGDPVGVEVTAFISPQPEFDHTPGAGTRCWVTGQAAAGAGNGSADVDGGRTTLLSPAFALANVENPVVGYWRYYSNVSGSAPAADTFRVDVSGDNGTNWTNAETVGPAGLESSGGWYYHQFRVADFVAPTNQVRVRFVAEDLGSGSIIEAALDDFSIQSVVCSGYATICTGDGAGNACPCANTGAAGRGCANSTGAGALLSASGSASLSNDSFVLHGTGMPGNATALYVQSAGIDHAGLGTQLGDGLRCISGSSVRLGVKSNSGGASNFPSAGDSSISTLGALTIGATRYYHVWYRDSSPSFCTTDTFNYTNGITATWGP